jgi:hypothetical protein
MRETGSGPYRAETVKDGDDNEPRYLDGYAEIRANAKKASQERRQW